MARLGRQPARPDGGRRGARAGLVHGLRVGLSGRRGLCGRARYPAPTASAHWRCWRPACRHSASPVRAVLAAGAGGTRPPCSSLGRRLRSGGRGDGGDPRFPATLSGGAMRDRRRPRRRGSDPVGSARRTRLGRSAGTVGATAAARRARLATTSARVPAWAGRRGADLPLARVARVAVRAGRGEARRDGAAGSEGTVAEPSAQTRRSQRFRIEPMRIEHIPVVSAIERRCFAQPWPQNAYRREIQSNKMAHYFVARLFESDDPGRRRRRSSRRSSGRRTGCSGGSLGCCAARWSRRRRRRWRPSCARSSATPASG